MKQSKAENIISEHTVKKFDFMESYVKSWIHKLMNIPSCNEIIFIDCMSNSGIYKLKETGAEVKGTPIRVSQQIFQAMSKYPNKKATLYF